MDPITISKKDVETLTNNIFENRTKILEVLCNEYVEIDPDLLYSNYRHKFASQMSECAGAPHSAAGENDEISVDEFEEIFTAMEEIDTKLPDLPNSEFKEPQGVRRYGSKCDVNDSTMSSSMKNLTLIRRATVPFMSILPPRPPQEPSLSPESDIKLTNEDLAAFNALKRQIKDQLNVVASIERNEDPFGLAETGRKISESFDRLKKFLNEIITLAEQGNHIKIKKETYAGSGVSKVLDDQWIQSLRELSEVIYRYLLPIP